MPARFILLLVVLLVFTVMPSIIELATEWLWFNEVAYDGIFTRTLTAKATIGSVVFFLAFGWLSDRVHRSRLLAAMFAGRALLFVLLLYVAGNPVLLFMFALIFGILNFATLSPIASLVASHFGMRGMGLTLGLLFGVHSLGAATGAIFGGFMFDLMARYDWVWLISIALAFIAAAVSLLIKEEHDDTRPRLGVPVPA